MAKVTFSPVMAKHSYFGSIHLFDFVTPQRGKTNLLLNTQHRTLTVIDSDDTNPHCRQNRFAEFDIPKGIPLDKICPNQLLQSCTNPPFEVKGRGGHSQRFKDKVNKACIAVYHKMLQLIESSVLLPHYVQ